MGSWDLGPFDNDDAADFAGDLSDTTDRDAASAALSSAFAAVLKPDDDYLEAPDVSIAVAAAAVVALVRDPSLPEPVSMTRARLDALGPVPDQLVQTARDALTRAFEPEDNEWHELWAEAAQVDAVAAALAPYRAALG